ncbi:MAG: MgtC/SapB family protein [Eubacterium sp.]|nr:MgtC/SapB family protein [Eubacterium sp.]
MLTLFDGIRSVTSFSVCIRMLLALLCGGVVGMERSFKNRPAGMRTHMLVCIGATIASVTGLFLYLDLQYPTDLSRIGAQVVAGLSFIGAGTIIVTRKNTIKGLTTAAGLWATGIIGLAIGAGFYEGAIIATFLILLAETWFAEIGKNITHITELNINVIYDKKESLDNVMRYCKDNRLAINNLEVNADGAESEEPTQYQARIAMSAIHNIHRDKILLHIRTMDGIRFVEADE